jgi:hypothetical protein
VAGRALDLFEIAPFSSVRVIKVARIECAENPRLRPMRAAYFRTMPSMRSGWSGRRMGAAFQLSRAGRKRGP